MHETIPVTTIMVPDVVTAPTDATAMDAARLMRDRGVSSVVVVRDGDPVGIVTEGDFATHLCQHEELGHIELADVMSTPLETIGPDTSIVEAARRLQREDIEHLPVVESVPTDDGDDTRADRLVGIVTTMELSHFVPQLAHARPVVDAIDRDRPRRRVRTDTLYERDDWEFEYRGADETRVSVGDVARFSKSLSESDVERFAEVTGDTNRLHLDPEYAAETRFGGPIVHGTLATGLISAALARLPGLTIYLSQEVTYLGPISVGDRPTAVCEVIDDLGDEKYRIATSVVVEGDGDGDGDGTTVLEGEAAVLVDELPPEPVLEREPTA